MSKAEKKTSTRKTSAKKAEDNAQTDWVERLEVKNCFVRPATISIAKQLKVAGKVVIDDTSNDTIDVMIFHTRPAVAKWSKGLTLEMGRKFHFARFDIGAEIPCYVEQFGQAMDLAELLVEERLQKEVDSVNEYIEGS